MRIFWWLAGLGLLTTVLLILWLPRWEPVRVWRLGHAGVEQLQSQAAETPEDACVHYVLGQKLAASGRHREAVESFGAGLRQLEREDDLALRAKIDGELAGSLVACGEHRLAYPYMKRALELDAGNVAAHMALGRILMHRSQYEVAAQEFRSVTMLEPQYAEAWYELGRAHNKGRKPQEAEQALQQAVKLAPRENRYLRELGDSFAYRSQFEEAAVAFERALATDPDDRSTAGALARTRVLMARTPEEYAEARRGLLPFTEEDQGGALFLGQLGVLDTQFGYLPEAEKHLKRAIALKPDYPEAWYNLSVVYTRQGREAEAQQAIKRFQQLEELYRRVNLLRKRASIHPKDLGLHLELARRLEQQGKYREAYQQFHYVLRLKAAHPDALSAIRRLARHQSETATPPPGGQP